MTGPRHADQVGAAPTVVVGRPSTVVIADAHPVVVDGLRAQLAAQPELKFLEGVGEVDAVVPAVGRLHPDVVLMGYDLWPAAESTVSMDVVRTLVQATRVVLIYDAIDAEDVWRVLHARVMGLVSRGAAADQFVQALRQALGGNVYLDERVQRELAEFIGTGGTATAVLLTRREKTVLGLVADGMNNEQIAVRIQLSQASVKYALDSIYRKLGVHDRSAAVAQALRRKIIT